MAERRGMDGGTGESARGAGAHQCWLSGGCEAHKHSMSHGEKSVLLLLSFPLIAGSQHSYLQSCHGKKNKKEILKKTEGNYTENMRAPKTKPSPTVLYVVCDRNQFFNYLCRVVFSTRLLPHSIQRCL